MNEFRKSPRARKNIAQARLERIKPELKQMQKADGKLDKLKNNVKSIFRTQKKKRFFTQSSQDTVSLSKTFKKNETKYSADERLKKVRTQLLRNRDSEISQFTVVTRKITDYSVNTKREGLNSGVVSCNANEFQHCVYFDVEMADDFKICSPVKSKQVKTVSSDTWPTNDSERNELNFNFEIDAIRMEPSYFSFQDSIAQDIEMKLCLPPGELLIVVDTNIFISHLQFLMRIIEETKISTFHSYVIVIPWLVLHEIDCLMKRKIKNLSAAANSANKFIFDCLRKCHPRIFGQSLDDFKANFSSIKTVDDYLVQYCLKFVESRYSVILLTDDKNLCNKSMVSSLPVFTKDDFEKNLLSP